MSSIKVKKVAPKKWTITCDTCTGDRFDLLAILAGGNVWAVGTTHEVALTLAGWHAKLHREQQCGYCLHVPPLPRPHVVDGNGGLFRLDGKLYTVNGNSVVLMEPATS